MRRISLGHPADYHVHLRQGSMMHHVTPTVRQGGVSLAYIMPNLTPPITTIEQVTQYHKELQEIAPKTTFLMTFYLSKDLTPELVQAAAEKGVIRGIKCYPAGVTTNSSAGVDPNDFTAFYPIFKVMSKYGLVLNLHGEKPSVKKDDYLTTNDEDDIHVMNAEPKFLPALAKLHKDFPELKIVLEHCTTAAATEAVDLINKDLPVGQTPTVVASITAHHLFLTVDDWAGAPVNFCKPVAKLPSDKRALLRAATSGKPWFIFGSDSAPHDVSKKCVFKGVCAGVYTQPYAISYVAEAFDTVGKLDKLKGFVSEFGHQFYETKSSDLVCQDEVFLVEKELQVEEMSEWDDGAKIVPFLNGEKLHWDVEWVSK